MLPGSAARWHAPHLLGVDLPQRLEAAAVHLQVRLARQVVLAERVGAHLWFATRIDAHLHVWWHVPLAAPVRCSKPIAGGWLRILPVASPPKTVG